MILGTIINVGTILLGTSIGVLLNRGIPKRITSIIFQGLGLFSIFLGLSLAFQNENSFLLILMSLLIGGLLGEWWKLESKTELLSQLLKSKINNANPKFTEGLITATMIFSIGSMAIIGPMNEALHGDLTLVLTKSVMDGFTSMALAAAFGWGVIFSAIPVFIFQAFFGISASLLEPYMNPLMINQLTAVGGILIIGIGINILEIKNIKVLNLIPSMFIIPILFWLQLYFSIYFNQ